MMAKYVMRISAWWCHFQPRAWAVWEEWVGQRKVGGFTQWVKTEWQWLGLAMKALGWNHVVHFLFESVNGSRNSPLTWYGPRFQSSRTFFSYTRLILPFTWSNSCECGVSVFESQMYLGWLGAVLCAPKKKQESHIRVNYKVEDWPPV